MYPSVFLFLRMFLILLVSQLIHFHRNRYRKHFELDCSQFSVNHLINQEPLFYFFALLSTVSIYTINVLHFYSNGYISCKSFYQTYTSNVFLRHWVQNSLGTGLTLLIDFGFGVNGFENLRMYWILVYRVCENPQGSGWVFGF